jgi:hypothetical protein
MPTKKERKRCHYCGRRFVIDKLERTGSPYHNWRKIWVCGPEEIRFCEVLRKRVRSGS